MWRRKRRRKEILILLRSTTLVLFILSNLIGTPVGTRHHVLLTVLPLEFRGDQLALWESPMLPPKPICPRPSPSFRSSWLHYHFLLFWTLYLGVPSQHLWKVHSWSSTMISFGQVLSSSPLRLLFDLGRSYLLPRDSMARIGLDFMCESCFSCSGLVSPHHRLPFMPLPTHLPYWKHPYLRLQTTTCMNTLYTFNFIPTSSTTF